MNGICAANMALNPAYIQVICAAAAATSAGVAFAPCFAALESVNLALKLACADPSGTPVSPGASPNLVSESCSQAARAVDIYEESQEFVSARAVAVNRRTLQRFESESQPFSAAPPDFLLEIGEPKVGEPVILPVNPDLATGYTVEFPLHDCATLLGQYTAVVKRVIPPSEEAYDTIRISGVAETSDRLTIHVPGVELDGGRSFDLSR